MPHPPATANLSSMGRGFEVIAALSELARSSGVGASVTAVAERLGRDRSQVSRTLAALDRRGYVTRQPHRGYRLAWRWYAEAQEITELRLRTEGLTILDELADEVGESCFIGVLRGADTVTIVESVPPASRMIGSWIGRAYPADCSDAGQAVLWDADDDEVRDVFAVATFDGAGPRAPRSVDEFLARLDSARERGFAIVDEEAEAGLYSVSAPVRDFRFEVVAAVQIVGERAALIDRTSELGERCRTAAGRLSSALGVPSSD
ncbi:IclR family transcriptional regulator [Microbacterium sp. B2969]|uniref:IclR family transcriptional regulator n=1 Tax=Microbacterium alkaliflavum TaxID=3248839 RepID=A0ABW7QAX4_9MICO